MELKVERLTLAGVRDTIRSRLGSGSFKVELTEAQYDDAIRAALSLFSTRKPMVGYAGLDVNPQIKVYKIEHDIGFGIFNVDFVQPDPQPSAIFYANLLDVAPVKPATMDSYDLFLRWRKTFMRVTSVRTSWTWDEVNHVLMINSPIDRTRACYMWHMPRTIEQIPLQHTYWFLDYATARAKLTLGQVRSKFSGVMPGPSRDLQMNGDALKSEAQADIERLETSLISNQGDRPPLVA